jgi:hypothetical protein
MAMQNMVQVSELGSDTNLKIIVELCYLADDEVVEVFEVFMTEAGKSLNCVLLDFGT